MRLDRISVGGVLRFGSPITLDLASLPRGLVAVTGENGSGKTTLVEAPIAALYRTFPSRDGRGLVDYATTREAFLEAVFTVDTRGTYRARVNLDGPRRAADAVLVHTAPDGTTTTLNDGKLSTYDEAVARIFPAKDVLLASAVAAQNRVGSFVTLDKRGRKELFQTLLGLDRFDAWATTARQAGQRCSEVLVGLQAQRAAIAAEAAPTVGATLRAEIARTAEAQHDVGRLLAGAEQDRTRLQADRATLADAAATHRTATARLRDLTTEAAAHVTRAGELRRQREVAEQAARDEHQTLDRTRDQQLADLDGRIANNDALTGRADAIRAAAERLQATRQQLAGLQAAVDANHQEANVWRTRLQVAERDVAEAERAQVDLARAEAAAGRLAGVCDACTFVADARAAQTAIPRLQTLAADLNRRRAVVETAVAEAQAVVAAAGTLLADREGLLQAQRDDEATAGLVPRLDAAQGRLAELRSDREVVQQQHAASTAAVARRLALTLDDLETQRVTLEAARARVAAETAERQTEADATADAAVRLAAVEAELAAVDRHRTTCIADEARLVAAAAALDQRLAVWEAKAAQWAALAAQLAAVEAERADWQLLARALGRDGLPVLEIDAAGPTVSAYCNDLLASCFGPRFTVELITQAEKADGKGTKEVFELRVLDNLRGGDARDLTDLSGGEQILVDEALKNALALFINSRQVGAVETMWRDETTGPLDPENALRYVDMLRRVAAIGGVRHVLFVSHNPAAAARADVQVRLADGQLTVVRPPFREAA